MRDIGVMRLESPLGSEVHTWLIDLTDLSALAVSRMQSGLVPHRHVPKLR